MIDRKVVASHLSWAVSLQKKTVVPTGHEGRSLDAVFTKPHQQCKSCRLDSLRHEMPNAGTVFSSRKFIAHLAALNNEGRLNTTTGHHVISAFADYINRYLPQSSYSERLMVLCHLDWGILPTVLPMNNLKEYKLLLGEGLDPVKLVEAQLVTKTLVHYVGGYENKDPGTHCDVPSGICQSGRTQSEQQVCRNDDSDTRKPTTQSTSVEQVYKVYESTVRARLAFSADETQSSLKDFSKRTALGRHCLASVKSKPHLRCRSISRFSRCPEGREDIRRSGLE